MAPDRTTGRDPPQRREARFAKRRCSLHPGVFCRDAGSAGHGATRVARPFRSLQTRVFASGMEARQGGAASLAPFASSPPGRGRPEKA
ncbi:hypothetical protein [Escherichia coli]|uniref:hypothetical protein n=1 Tax=Escherichia coli TaxID=562 RepID=UPI001EDE0637|nr:hypothetical protein [Escherichia coli]